MPVDRSLTPRQLRTIADRVEQLTTARLNNTAMGVPTTPDQFECRFPSGHRGTVRWEEAPLTSVKARERNAGKPVHRYVVELHPVPTSTQGMTLELNMDGAGDAMRRAVRSIARGDGEDGMPVA
jgi:hypothetical protein